MSHRARPGRRIGASAALVLLITLVAGALQPAAAHPFGDPESAEIGRTASDKVRVHWQVGMLDDYTYLAQELGLLDGSRELLDGAVDVRDGDPALLEDAAPFRAYVLQHIGVAVGDRQCRGEVAPIADLATDGVDVDFTCPSDVATATVSISMLTDLSEYYTTLATGPDGQRQAYAGGQTTYDWSFDAASAADARGTGRSAAVQLAGVGIVAVLAAAGLIVLRRRRGRAGSGGRAGDRAGGDDGDGDGDEDLSDRSATAGAGA